MPRTLTVIAATALATLAMSPAAVATQGVDHDFSPRVSFGTFEPYHEGADAVTYDKKQVPPGATAQLLSQPLGNNKTKVFVTLTGLEPNREYGAHVHTNPCGPTGDDAGPHFQQVPDPVQPSVDPAYANPENEVWLDFHTDASGTAVTSATGDWQLRERSDANSFVIHEEHTHTAPGEAGEAGARLGCLNAEF